MMYRLIITLLLCRAALFAASPDILFTFNYSDLPFKTRVEHSGIYGISSFAVRDNQVYFKTYDSPDIYRFAENKLVKAVTGNYSQPDNNSAPDFVPGSACGSESDELVTFRECFNTRDRVFHSSAEGFINSTGGSVLVLVPSRNELVLNLALNSSASRQSFKFNGDLAAADLIGIDKNGIEFLLIEKYISEIPLKVKREVWTVSAEGRLLSVLEVPIVKCLSTVKDFTIDADGNLYHFITEQYSASVIKWAGLAEYSKQILQYPPRYRYEKHFNQLIPTDEIAGEVTAHAKAATSRNAALRLGESYVLYRYNCVAANLSPAPSRAPDGDTVKTPPRLILGRNAKIPYKWGGFNTLSSFASGLAAGRYAGDIHTSNSTSYAVGVDCSGFVSRCWQLSSHYATSSMPSITTLYASWDSLKPADAVHKVGHVRMFVSKSPNGSLRVVESSGRDWGVSYWSYLPSDLTGYSPRAYVGIEANYSFTQPELYSARVVSGGIQLNWQCDTAGVIGYRLYSSKDNATWLCLMDENTLKTNSAAISSANEMRHFRVSCVLNIGGTATEGNWSNVLSAGGFGTAKKILIEDGFYREIGTWRGTGHTFVYNYAKALEAARITVESVRSKYAQYVNLRDYAAIFRITGDQSTADETLNAAEQDSLKAYLQQGGSLFISGSEIGWDLYSKGSAADKDFYNNYLKAAYVADDAGVEAVTGESSSIFAGLSFQFAQTYEVDFPDAIGPNGGSATALFYSNNKVAAVQYAGTFGTSQASGRVIYLAFPLETTANDTAFNAVISRSLVYFTLVSGMPAAGETAAAGRFYLLPNYPNPFNPATSIKYSTGEQGRVTLKIYNVTGELVSTLTDEYQNAGPHEVVWNAAGCPSGVYYCRLSTGTRQTVIKLTLLK